MPFHKEICAKGDKACILNQTAHYCRCEQETAEIPKSVYCDVKDR